MAGVPATPTCSSRSRARLRGAFVALIAAALLTTGGCSRAPDVMAYVGSSTISVSQLDAATKGVTAALGQQVNKRAVVSALISGEAASQIAAAHQVTITDEQRIASLSADQTGQKLLTNPAAKSVGFGLADEQLLVARLGQSTYAADLKTMKIRVNPRYGTWSPTQGLSTTSGSLSEPDPASTQTP